MPTPTQIRRSVRLLIEGMVREGKDADAIRDAANSVIRDARINDAFERELQAEADASVKHLKTTTGLPAVRSRIAEVLAKAGAEFANVQGKCDAAVADTVGRMLAEGRTAAEIDSAVAQQHGRAERAARAIAETAARAFSRISVLLAAQEAGIDKFKYKGPKTGTRKYCGAMTKLAEAGQTFTREEILAMRSAWDLPLDPLLYCGGWRCRHNWAPVIDDPDIPQNYDDLTKTGAVVVNADAGVIAVKGVKRLSEQVALRDERYKTFINSASSSGYIAIHRKRNAATVQREIDAVRPLMDENGGRVIKLLSEQVTTGNTGKKPDYDIDGELAELATITSASSGEPMTVVASVRHALGKGVNWVFLTYDKEPFNLDAINEGLRRALIRDTGMLIQKITLTHNGTSQTLTREEFEEYGGFREF